MNIHPKVAWPAIATAVLALVKAILIAYHVSVPADVQTTATALILLVAGYLAPSEPVAVVPVAPVAPLLDVGKIAPVEVPPAPVVVTGSPVGSVTQIPAPPA